MAYTNAIPTDPNQRRRIPPAQQVPPGTTVDSAGGMGRPPGVAPGSPPAPFGGGKSFIGPPVPAPPGNGQEGGRAFIGPPVSAPPGGPGYIGPPVPGGGGGRTFIGPPVPGGSPGGPGLIGPPVPGGGPGGPGLIGPPVAGGGSGMESAGGRTADGSLRQAAGGGVQAATRRALLGMLGKNPDDVSLNDPALKNQMDAFSLGQQRSIDRQRAALAERGAASGGGMTGGFDSAVQNAVERAGEAESAFGSELVAREMQAQRAQLMQALQLAAQRGDAAAQRDLQMKLAVMDNALRSKLGMGQLGLGYAQLGAGQQNFYDSLGWQMGQWQAGQNNLFGF